MDLAACELWMRSLTSQLRVDIMHPHHQPIELITSGIIVENVSESNQLFRVSFRMSDQLVDQVDCIVHVLLIDFHDDSRIVVAVYICIIGIRGEKLIANVGMFTIGRLVGSSHDRPAYTDRLRQSWFQN